MKQEIEPLEFKPSLLAGLWSVVLGLPGMVFFVGLGLEFQREAGHQWSPAPYICGLLAAYSALHFFGSLYAWKVKRWRMDARGIEGEYGLWLKRTAFVPWRKVRFYRVRGAGLWDYMVGARDILIDCSGDSKAEVRLHDIKDWRRAEAILKERVGGKI